MFDAQVLIVAASIAVGLAGYAHYFRSIFRGQTKPHVFTWLVYGIIDSIVVYAQIVKGAGIGAATVGFSVIVCFAVAGTAVRWGEKRITRSDWAAFVGALGAIAVWIATDDPLMAVVVAVVINILAIVPTFRKSFLRPHEETTVMWTTDMVKYGLSLFALSAVNLTTALFPVAIVITNGTLVAMILLRRRQLKMTL